MTGGDWGVVLAGLAAIAWVNWYFFVGGRSAASVASGAEGHDIRITVAGGYQPSVIRVPAGRPVRLTFVRQESNPCSEEIVIPAFGIRRVLPEGTPVTVDLPPSPAGRYPFQCGMGMLHGTLEVEGSGS